MTTGKEVNEEHPSHALVKLVPLDWSKIGKEASALHLCQLNEKSVTLDVSMIGKEVRELPYDQAPLKLVAPEKSRAVNLGVTRSVLPDH